MFGFPGEAAHTSRCGASDTHVLRAKMTGDTCWPLDCNAGHHVHCRCIELMQAFAERTGLTGSRPQRRYLWTDAFAVCNFLGLGQANLAGR